MASPQTPQASSSVSAGVKGTCGGGITGNGICPTPNECCSRYGFCGTSSDHCSVVAPVSAPAPKKPSANGWDNNGVGNAFPASASVAGTCGGGTTGNGICRDGTECCSSFGFCGTSADHCANRAPVAQAGQQAGGQQQYNPQPQQTGAQQSQQTVKGTCGGGATGNGFCSVSDECCSIHGFCGTSLEHCTNRYDPSSAGVQAAKPQAQAYNPPPTMQQTQSYNPPPTLPTFQQSFPQPPPTMGAVGNQPSTTVYYEDSTSGTAGEPYEARISYSKGPQSGVVGDEGGVPKVLPTRYPPVRPHGTNKKILGYVSFLQRQ